MNGDVQVRFCVRLGGWFPGSTRLCDSQSGAQAAAKMYSMILTAATHNLEPMQYLTYVLSELPQIRNNESIEHLLPWKLTRESLAQAASKLPSLG